MFDAALFVRSASPGAVLRFLERRKDPEKPAELLLSEAVDPWKWRALFAPSAYLEAVNASLSIAFDKTVLLLHAEAGWQADILAEGEWVHRGYFDTERKPVFFKAFSMRRMEDEVQAWFAKQDFSTQYAGLPTQYMTKPPKNVMDYDTVAILDQRNLLVEDSPRLYRFPL